MEAGRVGRVGGGKCCAMGIDFTRIFLFRAWWSQAQSPIRLPFFLKRGLCAGVWVGVGVEVVGTQKVRQLGPDICSPSGRLSRLAHAIRLLLEYTDSNYEEKKYTMGDGNDIFVMS